MVEFGIFMQMLFCSLYSLSLQIKTEGYWRIWQNFIYLKISEHLLYVRYSNKNWK